MRGKSAQRLSCSSQQHPRSTPSSGLGNFKADRQSGAPVSTRGGTGAHHGCQLPLQGDRSRQRVSEAKQAPLGPLSSIHRTERSGICPHLISFLFPQSLRTLHLLTFPSTCIRSHVCPSPGQIGGKQSRWHKYSNFLGHLGGSAPHS